MERHEEIIATWATPESPDFGYFDKFDTPEMLGIFWDERSRFRRAFDRLDLSDVLEIAAGAGRHSAQIVDRCQSLALIDTSSAAVELARTRFSNDAHVSVVLSDDGRTLPFPAGAFSAVFSYDAMVHFEPLTINSYLTEIARVLRPGGRAVLHHSAYTNNPTGAFRDNPGWRNFMPTKLMMHLGSRAGLTLISHETFRWRRAARRPWTPKTDALSVFKLDGQ